MSRYTPEEYEALMRRGNVREVGQTAALRILDPQAPKPSKYKNKRTEEFDSEREAARCQELELLQKAGAIRNLRRQVSFDLHAQSEKPTKPVGRFIADFTYEEWEADIQFWRPIVEDSKGMRTDLYKWKRTHFKRQYGISIRET